MSNPKFYQCLWCGYEWKHGKHGGHNCVETLNAHYEALREKCEELQALIGDKIEYLCHDCNTIYPVQSPGKILQPCPKCAVAMMPTSHNLRRIDELQRERDEAAKQEPRHKSKPLGCTGLPVADDWVEYYESIGCPYGRSESLYAKPTNLPALIEQAKAEERERLGKLIHYPECWDTACYQTLDDALTEIGCNPDCCARSETK